MHTVHCSSRLQGGGGGSAQRGLTRGVSSSWGVSSAWGYLHRGVSAQVVSGGCLPHPLVNRITDACEDITLPQLRCGR